MHTVALNRCDGAPFNFRRDGERSGSNRPSPQSADPKIWVRTLSKHIRGGASAAGHIRARRGCSVRSRATPTPTSAGAADEASSTTLTGVRDHKNAFRSLPSLIATSGAT